MAMHAILKLRPDAIFIQSESTQYFHPDGPDCEDAARRFNENFKKYEDGVSEGVRAVAPNAE